MTDLSDLTMLRGFINVTGCECVHGLKCRLHCAVSRLEARLGAGAVFEADLALDEAVKERDEARKALQAILDYVPAGFISPMDDEDTMNVRAIARRGLATHHKEGT